MCFYTASAAAQGREEEEEDMKKNGLLVMFPGTGYTCQEPLMQRCARKYRDWGYHVLEINHSHIPFKEIETIEEAMPLVQDAVREQVSGMDFESYDDLVFIAKSLGTITAGWLAKERNLAARNLYLTPVPLALPYITEETKVMGMVIGTLDPHVDYREIQRICDRWDFPCLVIEGVAHNLKDEDEARRLAIDEEILALCSRLP